MARFKPRYFQKIKISRGPRRVGEIFAIKFKGVGYFFGRVIRDDCAICPPLFGGPWEREKGRYLIYVYKDVSRRIEDVPDLRRDRLLIPPSIQLGNGGWTTGHFATVAFKPLTKEDVLPRHCFCLGMHRTDRWPPGSGPEQYWDEYGRRLRKRTEPCGIWGVGGYGALENKMARALGLPYDPDVD
ncbi:MAG: hypothetical protein KIT68_12610 [Phycisphaeraceae bacterium]|nr:hypothetical protein [Phycisphaeraceae bacterium]